MSTHQPSVARRHAANPDDWPFAPRFDPVRRWYHRLAQEPDSEVWLLTWLPGQTIDLHDLGLLDATDLEGGFAAWRAAGLPVIRHLEGAWS